VKRYEMPPGMVPTPRVGSRIGTAPGSPKPGLVVPRYDRPPVMASMTMIPTGSMGAVPPAVIPVYDPANARSWQGSPTRGMSQRNSIIPRVAAASCALDQALSTDVHLVAMQQAAALKANLEENRESEVQRLQVSEAEKRLREAENERDLLRVQLQEHQQYEQSRKDALEKAAQALRDMTSEVRESNNEAEALRQELKRRSEEAASLETKSRFAGRRDDVSRAELSNLREELQQFTQERSGLMSEMKELQAVTRRQEHQLKQQSSALNHHHVEQEALKNEVREYAGFRYETQGPGSRPSSTPRLNAQSAQRATDRRPPRSEPQVMAPPAEKKVPATSPGDLLGALGFSFPWGSSNTEADRNYTPSRSPPRRADVASFPNF